MPILKPEQIGQLIVASAEQYKETYMAEVQDQAKIIDELNTIKDPIVSREHVKNLTEKWQLKYLIQSVDETILNIITRKCSSNPILCL